MPPPSFQDQPKATKPQSSSGGILGAFRSLTGHRRGIVPPSTASTPTGAPLAGDKFLGSPVRPGKIPLKRGITEPANGISKPIIRDGDTHENGYTVIEHDSGSPEALLETLCHGENNKDRASAAVGIADVIDEYPLENVPVIWNNAADLLDQTPTSAAFSGALYLLKTCLRKQAVRQADKRGFFDAIYKRLTNIPVECLSCLELLTDRGENVLGLDDNKLASLIAKLLRASYDDTAIARRKIKIENSGSSAAEYDQFHNVFDFLIRCIKYNATTFQEAQLEILLQEVLSVCRKTSTESDLEDCLKTIDYFVAYASIPRKTLLPLTHVLCGIYDSVPALRESTLATLWRLLGSHHSHDLYHQLYTVFTLAPDQEDSGTQTIRGAVQIFREAFEAGDELSVRPDLGQLVPVLSKALQYYSKTVELEVLSLLNVLVSQNTTGQDIFAAEIWPGFCKTLSRCASGQHASDAQNGLSDGNDKSTDSLVARKETPGGFQHLFSAIAAGLFGRVTLNDDQAAHDTIMYTENTTDEQQMVMTLLLNVASCLKDEDARKVLDYHQAHRSHVPPDVSWLDINDAIRKEVLSDRRRELELRAAAVRMLNESYSQAVALGMRESQASLSALMECIGSDMDPTILEKLIEIVVDAAMWTDDADLFILVVDHLHDALFSTTMDASFRYDLASLRATTHHAQSNAQSPPPDTPGVKIAKGLVRLFLRTIHRSYTKASKLYDVLLEIARSTSPPADARIISLKVLVRLRADIEHGIFVVPKTESQNLATALCRTADSAVIAHIHDSPVVRPQKPEKSSHRSKEPSSASNPPLSRSSSSAGRGPNAGRMNQPTPPLWMYPGPKGLPEDPYTYASRVAFAYCPDQQQGPEEQTSSVRRGTLSIGAWLDTVMELMNSSSVNWEIFSYIVVHLGAQLSNHALFVDAIAQVKLLRRTICDKLTQRNFIEPPAFTNLKKSDAAVCLYQILTMLVSYHEHFTKDEEQDTIVRAFAFGIGSWERSSEMCIHGLSVCCHEMPELLVRHLDTALANMIKIVAQTNVAASILDFLATLARLPELFRNFNEDNFRNVFGVCFRYLQFARDRRTTQTEGSSSKAGTASSRSSRDVNGPMESITSGASLGGTLPQYVHTLAYHVMTFWFMALKLHDRAKHISWIIDNLKYLDRNGNVVLEEEAEVAIDMMQRVANSDRDETRLDPTFAKLVDGMIISKDYLSGNSILTLETAGRSGATQITTRRPSGTMFSTYRPNIVSPPRHQAPITIGLAADAYNDPDYIGMTPDHIIQMMFAPLSANPYLESHRAAPIALPQDEATRRAISTFDFVPALDGHKAAIIYVGERQADEAEILGNSMGSADYMKFLNGIGTLTELRGAEFNAQGLDREFDSDGKFTYCWRDRVTELVFHVTTMMPTDLERDPQCTRKKMHIGNDYVKIIFNNAGFPFDLDTFPSDFNYVNIVITPEARASFVETRQHAAKHNKDRPSETFYKVTVMTRADLPKISPASETKIISGSSLPTFVRLLTLNASVFSQVWSHRNSGDNHSSWLRRLREIKRLRERHAPPLSQAKPAAPEALSSPTSSPAPEGDRDRGAGAAPRSSSLLRRTSIATFFSEGGSSAKRSSLTADSTIGELAGIGAGADHERSSSSGSREPRERL